MKKAVSYIIAIMMVVAMMPCAAFAAMVPGNGMTGIDGVLDPEPYETKDITIGQPEEVKVYYYENKAVTVESEDTSIAYGMVTDTTMIISSGSVLYGSTIKITPSQIGTVDIVIKADGKTDKTYTINVKPVVASEDLHIGDSSIFEFASLYDEVISFQETEGLTFNVMSKTQRTSTMTVNGVAVKEIHYVYKIQVDYSQPGIYSYAFAGDRSGEIYNVTADVTDHEWEDEASIDREPSCAEEGLSAVHCRRCSATKEETNIPLLDHEYDWVIDQAATEEAAGIMHEECINCGAVKSEGTVIEQLTHTHDLEVTEAVQPSCTSGGNIKYYTCKTCGNFYEDEDAMEPLDHKDVLIEPLGHTVAIKSVVEATCTTDGMTEEAYCTVCGEILVPHKIVVALGHRYSSTWNSDKDSHWHQCECGLRTDEESHEFEWVIDKPATEEESGIKHEECNICHAVRNKNTNIDKLMHTHDLVKIDEVEPTCLTDGNIEYYVCKTCRNVYSDEGTRHLITMSDTVKKAKGHNYSEWMMISKSSCVRKGYEFTSCKDCGIAEIRELPLKSHKLKFLTIEPKCTEAGAKITQCEGCDMLISEEIPAAGHKITAINIEPTCTEAGWAGGTECSVCKGIIKEPQSIPMKGHSYGDWIIEKTPTCTDPGSEYRVCSTCKFVETAVIPRLEHTVEIIPAVAATCTATGLTEGICCTSCNNILKSQSTIEKTAHSWSNKFTVDRQATISSSGSMSRHCLECNAIDAASAEKIDMIKKATVNSLVYNGYTRDAAVKVINNKGAQLTKGTDFTVVYKNAAGTKTVKPENVGTYKAVVTFKGKYSGSVTKSFKITPKATAIKKLTKPAKKQIKVTWQKRTAQVSGYEIRYSTTKGFTKATTKTVKVKNYKTNVKTIKNLKAKKRYWVQVRTYKTAGNKTYNSKWSTAWVVTTN